MVTYKPLVFLAVLSTIVILACKDDPIGPDGTGRLTITVVPYEVEASAAADAESSAEARGSTATNKGPSERTPDETPDLNVGPETEEANAARQTAAAAPPRRDILRVNLSGPDTRTLDFTPNADGSVDVTIESLRAGSYSVELLGIDTDLGGELVSEYGINNSVTVRTDQTANATISFGSFLPVIDPTLPAQTSEFSFLVDYAAIPSATSYFFELDTDASFSAPTTLSLTGTSVIITTDVLGPNWMRVRAENSSVPAAQAKPSDPVLIDVVADISATGDDDTSAPLLGTGPMASGQYSNFNIYPETDEDWFAIDLATDVTLTVDVLTESLSSPPSGGAVAALEVISAGSGPSPLDPEVEIYDPSLNVIATNDDRDSTTVESRVSDVSIPVDGTYFIRVTSYSGGSVGHYELLITVNAEAVARVQIDPPFATILPGSTVDLEGRTFDPFDEVFGREAIWSSSDGVIATVDGTGLVTGQSIGTATITFESEGIQGTATIDVTNIPAAKVVITPRSGLLQGIGQTVQWSAQAFDALDNVIPGKPINWWGSNPAVADADAGLVEAFGNGQSIIVAEADGVEGYALITVTDPLSSVVNYWSDGPSLPSGSENLLAIWGASSSAIYTVGTNGTIMFNDGNSWSGLGVATTASLSGVWGADDQEIWTVGSGGKIFMSSDGASWGAEASPTTEQLRGVWGAAFDDVYAVGGSPGVAAMVHRDGATWTAVTGLPVANALNGVYGFASDEVFAVGDNGTIIRFDGTSWSAMINATVESLFAVWGTSPNDVYAVGASGRIVHYDGNVGQNWVFVASGTPESLLAVWGTNANDVLATGTNGAVVHYDGTTWSPQVSGTTNALRAIWGSPNPGVTVVGDLGTVRLGSRGASVIVTPGTVQMDALGSTLQLSAEVQDAVGTVLTGGTFGWGSSNDAIASVDGTGLVTANGNGTVTITATNRGISGTADVTVQQVATTVTITPDGVQLTTGTATQSFSATAEDANANPIAGATFNWTSLNGNIVTIDAAGLATQVAAGQATISADLDGAFGFALVTSTGPFGLGPVNLWSIDNSNTVSNLSGVWGSSRSDIYAVADDGKVMAYDGTDWMQSLNDPSAVWNGVWGLMPSEIYVVGNGGRLGFFDGSTWSVSTIGTAENLLAVWGTSPVDIFAVGNNGTIMHFDAGGWSAQTIGTQPLQRVWGTSSSDVFAIGGMGTILHYDGVSWSAQASLTTTSLFAIWGTAPNDVFVAGVGGETLHYNGVSWSVMTTPNTFGIMGLWGTATADLYGVGDQGATVFYNGATWSSITPIVTEGLKDVWGTSNPVVIGVGDGGRIVRGSRGVITSILPTTTNLDALGATVQLTAEARDQVNDIIVGVPWLWSSSDDLIATVDQNGLVTAVKNGSVTITASTQGFILNATVNVSQVAVAFAIVPNLASIAIGETLQLVGGSLDANNNPLETQPPITWSTDDGTVATVDGTGLVTAVNIGTATISAMAGINSANAAITVTIPTSAVPMEAGDRHSCAIDTNGTAFCWGDNQRGQLGDGSTNTSSQPRQVTGVVTFQSITVGEQHSCGIAFDGSAYCWGSNDQGQLGDGTNTSSSAPVLVTGVPIFAELDAGAYHTCGLTQIGVAFCWGRNSNGEIGDGSAGDIQSPSAVFGGRTYQSISGGRNHSCAVEVGTGDAYCWGANGSGELGNGSQTNIGIPVQVAAGGTTYKSISAGESHSCAVTTSGNANCWGNRDQGQLGDGLGCCGNALTPVLVSGVFSFRSISAGAWHTCAVTTSDAGYCWGDGWRGTIGQGTRNQEQTPTAVSGSHAFATLSAGREHTCGRTTGGEVYCWGTTQFGRLGDGSALTDTPQAIQGGLGLQSIDGGQEYTCALETGGAAWCWGRGYTGQLGDNNFNDVAAPVAVLGGQIFQSVRAGRDHTCGIEAVTNAAWCWGSAQNGKLGNAQSGGNFGTPVAVVGGFQFQAIDVSENHTCAVEVGGDMRCWGRNNDGELGDGTTISKTVPILVQGGHQFTAVAVGGPYIGFSCGVATDGKAYCWGNNDNGELGDGTNTSSGTPVAVLTGLTFSSITAGVHHVCALTPTGAAHCWGQGWSGQLGDNQFNSGNTPVAVSGNLTFQSLKAGRYFTCGLTNTNDMYCWGDNNQGQLGIGGTNSRGEPALVSGSLSYQAIGPGDNFTCAVSTANVGYCWGDGFNGTLGNGTLGFVSTPQLVVGSHVFRSPPTQ